MFVQNNKYSNSIPLYWLIVAAFLGCSMELDLSIPSFPNMMEFFYVSEAQIQYTLSANFLGLCIASIIYGPLSESFGRRLSMLFGLFIFLIGSIGCVFAPNIDALISFRFLQGMGAGGPIVVGFAMIGDRHQGEQASYYIGRLNALITVFMAVAPIIGGFISKYFSWKVNFSVILCIAILSYGINLILLPETLENKTKLNPKNIINDFITLLSSKKFMLYALVPNLLVTGYLTYIGSTAFYYMKTCGLLPLQFAINQGIVVASFSIMSFTSGKVVKKLGENNSALLGMLITLIGSIALVTVSIIYPFNPYLVTVSTSIFAIGAAFAMSVTFAQSLNIFPKIRGTASSFIMSSRLLLSAVTVAYSGKIYDGTMMSVAIIIFICVAISTAISFVIYNKDLRKLFNKQISV